MTDISTFLSGIHLQSQAIRATYKEEGKPEKLRTEWDLNPDIGHSSMQRYQELVMMWALNNP